MSTLVKRTNYTVTCLFCGSDRTATSCHDDGYDYMGHRRGKNKSWTNDSGCDCTLGKLSKEGGVEIKRMCKNCRYYSGGTCKNQETLKEVRELTDNFVLAPFNEIEVKKPKNKCKHHKLKYTIFSSIVKDET